eukprot:TRINITY_DN5608_c0_g1_i2.p1 TRINITY_DN5608_c0_g1~~TRINITY_DN5608_c0_g1_i2.p1  ORF type:complete len:230 (+),score=42.54 TRINITY_DN5608_c0_g1_i2:70-759(+)
MDLLAQRGRPSWHSGALLASNAAFAAGACAALRSGHVLRRECHRGRSAAACPAPAAVRSAVRVERKYLQLTLCVGGLDILGWHAVDVWVTFAVVNAVFAVTLLRVRRRGRRRLLRAAQLALVTAGIGYDRFNPLVSAGLYAAAVVPVLARAGARRVALRQGMLLLAAAAGCFISANAAPGPGGERLRSGPEGVAFPHLPETTLYWLWHSLWHLAVVAAALALLRTAPVQ